MLEEAVARAWAPVAESLDARRIAGAAFGAVTRDGARATRYGGFAAWRPVERPLTPAHRFDLASLTKVMLTTVETLRLVEDGLIDLDDPLGHGLSGLAPAVGRLSVRQLLAHTGGLPAHEAIFRWPGSAEDLRARVIATDWPLGPPVYSDIGFMLLGFLIERRRGRLLADLLPAGCVIAPGDELVVATEECPWRGRVLQGEVHDENAFALGGLAGHAGLFATLESVLDFALALMRGDSLGAAAATEMSRPDHRTPTSGRALGWEIKHPRWSGGSLCSPATIGHTGFTGTGLWLDLERGVAWALLTNRVHPDRAREMGIIPLRKAVGNRLMAGWGDAADDITSLKPITIPSILPRC